jgi:hypothetical protein
LNIRVETASGGGHGERHNSLCRLELRIFGIFKNSKIVLSYLCRCGEKNARNQEYRDVRMQGYKKVAEGHVKRSQKPESGITGEMYLTCSVEKLIKK